MSRVNMASYVVSVCLSAFFVTCLFCHVLAVEELIVVHAPESVKFLSSEPVHSSYLGDIMSAMFAYTVPSKIDWHSMAVVSPWKRPDAILVLEILGFDSGVDMTIEGTRFLLENAGDIDKQFDLLSRRTSERFLRKRPVLLHMDLADELYDSKIVQPLLLKSIPGNPDDRLEMALKDPELGALIEDSTFNSSLASDVQLLTEIATLKEILKALRSHKSEVKDKIPDVYWLKMGGLKPVARTYGADSFQFREALRLLRQMITDVKSTMHNIYDDRVVVAVMKVNEPSSTIGFSKRNLLAAEVEQAEKGDNDYNLAVMWNPEFPVTFTIIAFISIAMGLAVLGISVAMWNMDPGRDSIVYRQTKRMKKD